MANTVREFLVSLGVDVKTTEVNRFNTTVDNMTTTVVKFGKAVVAVQAAITAMLVKTADAMEQMFYTAQRAATTVTNLRALQYGMSQIGLSAHDASTSLENLAMSMRLNPGSESLLRYLGVATRSVNGSMRDTSQIMGDFIGRLRRMPFYIAAQYAEQFGINARTLQMLLQNFDDLGRKQERWKELAKQVGVNLDQSGRVSRDFMNVLRETGEIIQLMWIKVSTVLLDKFKPQLEEFNRFLLSHAKEIESFALSVADAITSLTSNMTKLLPEMDELVRSTIGWKVALNAIADIIAYRIFGPLGLAVALFMQLRSALADTAKERDFKFPSETGKSMPKEDKDKMQKDMDALTNTFRNAIERMFPGLLRPFLRKSSGEGFDASGVHRIGLDGAGTIQKTLHEDHEDLKQFFKDLFSGRYSLASTQPPSLGPTGFDPSGVRLAGGGTGRAFAEMRSAFNGTFGRGSPGALLDPRIESEVRRNAKLRGLDEEHMVRLARAEAGGFDRRSPAGAYGPMQLMPKTARDLGVDIRNWQQNIEGGVRYYAQQLRRFQGNYFAADAAYNAGPNNRRVHEFHRSGDPSVLPLETQKYLRSINGPDNKPLAIKQENHYHISGVTDPSAVRALIERHQAAANAQLVRYFRGAVIA